MTARLSNKLPGKYCAICNRRAGGSKSRQESPSGQPPFTVWVHSYNSKYPCWAVWKNLWLGLRYGTSPIKLKEFMYDKPVDTGRTPFKYEPKFQEISRLSRKELFNFDIQARTLVDGDYSQIEPRVIAAISEDEETKKDFFQKTVEWLVNKLKKDDK